MIKRILLAEDDAAVAYIIKNRLAHLNVEVMVADTGALALEHLRSGKRFDLIISDIVMPKIDGLELRTQIMDDEKLREIPFIFMTGHLAQATKAQMLGPYLVLTKPVDSDDLSKIIENILF